MKICMVSTYPPTRCGVAYYTEKLTRSLRSIDGSMRVFVITEKLTENNLTYPFRILKKIIEIKPSIVHFQHEYLMYGFYGIPLTFILFFLRILGYPVVTTLHTVIPYRVMVRSFFNRYGLVFLPVLFKKMGVLAFTRLICKLASTITVHSSGCKLLLKDQYGVEAKRIVIVGHGIEQSSKIPAKEAKRILGVDGKRIMLCMGFVKPDKGFESAIEALKTTEYCDYTLVIAGSLPFRRSYIENEYVRRLHALVDILGLEKRVIFIERFLSETDMRILLSAADLVYLPYKLDTCGASGIYCLAKGFGSTIVASDVNRFKQDLSSDWNSVARRLIDIYSGLTQNQ